MYITNEWHALRVQLLMMGFVDTVSGVRPWMRDEPLEIMHLLTAQVCLDPPGAHDAQFSLGEYEVQAMVTLGNNISVSLLDRCDKAAENYASVVQCSEFKQYRNALNMVRHLMGVGHAG